MIILPEHQGKFALWNARFSDNPLSFDWKKKSFNLFSNNKCKFIKKEEEKGKKKQSETAAASFYAGFRVGVGVRVLPLLPRANLAFLYESIPRLLFCVSDAFVLGSWLRRAVSKWQRCYLSHRGRVKCWQYLFSPMIRLRGRAWIGSSDWFVDVVVESCGV